MEVQIRNTRKQEESDTETYAENENLENISDDSPFDRKQFKRKGTRKRSKSHHFIPHFGDKIYQRIEAYLDEEGLYVSSGSPINQPKKLRACNIKPLSIHPTECPKDDSEENITLAKPLFLVKRIMSLETPSVALKIKESPNPSRFKSKTVLQDDD